MIQPDTLQIIKDSAPMLRSASMHHPATLIRIDSLAHADSLTRVDSLHMVDSLHVADSIKLALLKPTGFIGIPHPLLPQTELWVFVALFILFGFLVFLISRSSELITDTIKTLFQVKERSSIFSKASVYDFQFRLFMVIFAIFILSFYAYLVFYQNNSSFSLTKYGLFLLVTSLYFVFKLITFELIGYVFLENTSFKLAKESYFNIISLLGLILFPLLVLQIYIPSNFVNICLNISLFVSISACILIIIKLFQIFFHKTVAFFYILLYLCTLEILPLFALYRAYQLLM